MIEAQQGCCQEAAMGMGDAYIPCNKPAICVIGWNCREDAPLRMCFACAAHNVKNRGGYIVRPFKVDAAGKPRSKPNAKRQKADYSAETVRNYQNQLTSEHVSVLLAAAEKKGSYAEIAVLLNRPVGTIKSSLSRARRQLAKLIENAVEFQSEEETRA